MAARGHAAEHRMLGRDRQRIGLAAERRTSRRQPRLGQEKAGETKGQRRLADALGPGDQPGMGQPARVKGRKQQRLGGGVADQLRVLARRRQFRGFAFARRFLEILLAHAAILASKPTALKPLAHRRLDRQRTAARSSPRIDDDAALWLALGDVEEALAHALVEIASHALETRLGACGGGSAGRASTGKSRIRVRSGTKFAGDQAMQFADTLARQRRRRSPDRPRSNPRTGRTPPSLPAASAGRMVSIEWLRRAATISSASVSASQRATSPASRRSRISSAPGEPPGSRVTTALMPALPQRLGQKPRLGRFAGALAALEGDEAAAFCRVQLRFPKMQIARGGGHAPERAEPGHRLRCDQRHLDRSACRAR